VGNLPRGFNIPPMLMSLDRDLEDPSEGITTWPKRPQLLQCPAENVSDHPWCNRGQESNCGDRISELSNEGQMDDEQAKEQRVEEERVEKGKQRAHEMSSHDASPSEPVAPEGRGRHSGHAQTRGRSQSRRPRKRVKSAPIVDSDDEDTAKPIHRVVTKTYNLHNPPPDFPILPAMDRCDHCARRMLPCARKEDHACFQCNKGKHGCSLSLKRMRSRSQSRAPATRTSQPDPPLSLAPTPAPPRTNPPRLTHKRKAKSPVSVDVASARPAHAAGPSTPGPSRGKRESKLNICFIPFC